MLSPNDSTMLNNFHIFLANVLNVISLPSSIKYKPYANRTREGLACLPTTPAHEHSKRASRLSPRARAHDSPRLPPFPRLSRQDGTQEVVEALRQALGQAPLRQAQGRQEVPNVTTNLVDGFMYNPNVTNNVLDFFAQIRRISADPVIVSQTSHVLHTNPSHQLAIRTMGRSPNSSMRFRNPTL